MDECTFNAIGTKWSISIDCSSLDQNTKAKILDYISVFENRFSRFLPDSEVNQFRTSVAGEYTISKEFAILLKKADRLRILTNGMHDPAIGQLLESAGYNAGYRLKEDGKTDQFILPKWCLDGEKLKIEGPISFDLGGIGKGYCIDKVADILKSRGYKFFIVDAGGDMFGTSKADGSAWRIAIQYPGKPDMAAGVINLQDQALAVSDSFRRKWGKWHHIVDPKLKESVKRIIGAVAVAPNTWHADCMTSALYLTNVDKYENITKEFDADYLAFKDDGSCVVSSNWRGELFV